MRPWLRRAFQCGAVLQPLLRSSTFLLFIVAAAPCIAGAAESTPVCGPDVAKEVLNAGDFKLASSTLRQSIAAHPLCPETHYLLAYSLMRQNLAKGSLAEYTTAARLRSPGPADLRNVALDYALLEDYADAERWTRRSLALNDKDAESWYVLGRIEYSAGQARDAVDSFHHALAILPDSLKAENNLGLAYEGLNQQEKAAECYRSAIALGDKSGKPSEQPLINLAILLAHEGKPADAIDLLNKAVSLSPSNADARAHLGQVYLEANRLDDAQSQLEKAVALQPSNARFHFLLGQAYRRAGLSDKAKAEQALSASLNGTHSTPDYFK